MITIKRYIVNFLVSILPPTRGFRAKRALWRFTGGNIGEGVRVNSGAKIWGAGEVEVGPDSWLGMNMVLIVPTDAKVTIGRNVDIGPDVLLECGTHELGLPERRAGAELSRSIEIGSGTWIGCRVTILGGAHIGVGSVIAAGSLLKAGNYPDHVLLGGVPAKVLRQLDAG